MRRPRRVLIIVENLPVQRDARVKREAQALLGAGYGVSVISPRGDTAVPAELRGVDIHQYRPPSHREGKLGFIYEFLYSWVVAMVLALRALAREGFDVVQACNPPDTYFALALPFKLLGKPFVFDHHDLCPEHYRVQFGEHGLLLRGLLALEWATFRTADHVIATNEYFRQIAMARGGRAAKSVTVVRNGPELDRVHSRDIRPTLRQGRRYLACWVGVMRGFDDGVELALDAVSHLVTGLGRDDCHFVFIGDGERFDEVVRLARKLGIEDYVTFPGWLPHDTLFDYLATADVGLQPIPKNERTDVSTAIKTMEYMAFGLPVVAFDLLETRSSAGDAAAYAAPNDVLAYAELVAELLDDPERRAAMGELGRRRVEQELAWDHQRAKYVGVFDDLLEQRGQRLGARRGRSPR
jgi:glycosyltransferase involved in cell wall biosynthesis